MADADSIPALARSGPGRPRKDGNNDLPLGVYRRVRNGKARFYDKHGHALSESEVAAFAVRDYASANQPDGIVYGMLTAAAIVARSVRVDDSMSGVYFLVKAGAVVYVGQSTNMFRRVEAHRLQGKDFDRVTFLPAKEEVLRELEMYYIHTLRPAQNTLMPSLKRRHIYDRRLAAKRRPMEEAIAVATLMCFLPHGGNVYTMPPR